MLAAITAGATLGLVNLAHCAAMCGPLSSAASYPAGRSGPARYQLGRLGSYAFVGALSGHLGRVLQLMAPSAATLWLTSALTAGACLLTARSLFASSKSQVGLVQLRGTRPRRSVFSSLLALVPKEPLVLGALSALLPCGVLASALLAAVASGDGSSGALLMLAFAAVSGIAVWAAGFGAQLAPARSRARFAQVFRRTFAYALVVLAAFTICRPIYALTRAPQQSAQHSPACH